MADSYIGKMAIQIAANTSGLAAGFATAQNTVQGFSQNVSGLLVNAMSPLAGAIGLAGAVGNAFTTIRDQVAGVVKPFTDLWHQGVEALKAQDRWQKKFGMSGEAASGIQVAAGMVGIASEEMEGGLMILSRRLGDVRQGSTDAALDFRKLGLDGMALANMPLEQALGQIADRFRQIPAGADRNAAAFAVLGRRGMELAGQLAKIGSGGIREGMTLGMTLGVTDSDKDIADVKRAHRATQAASFMLGTIGESFAQVFAISIAPMVEVVAEKIKSMVIAIQPALGAIRTFIGTIIGAFNFENIFVIIQNIPGPVFMVINMIIGAIGPIFNAIVNSVKLIFDGLTSVFRTVGDVLESFRGFSPIMNVIGFILGSVIGIALTGIAGAVRYIAELFGVVLRTIGVAVQLVAGSLFTALGYVIGVLAKLPAVLGGNLFQDAANFMNQIANDANRAADNLIRGFSATTNSAEERRKLQAQIMTLGRSRINEEGVMEDRGELGNQGNYYASEAGQRFLQNSSTARLQEELRRIQSHASEAGAYLQEAFSDRIFEQSLRGITDVSAAIATLNERRAAQMRTPANVTAAEGKTDIKLRDMLKEIELIGKTKQEQERLNLVREGASAEQIVQYDRLRRVMDTRNIIEDIKKATESILEQNDAIGMTREESEILAFRRRINTNQAREATAEELNGLRAAQSQRQERESAVRLGERMLATQEANISSISTFNGVLADLRAQMAEGLGFDDFALAVGRGADQLMRLGDEATGVSMPSSLMQGSQGAITAINRFQSQGPSDPVARLEAGIRRQTEIQEEQLRQARILAEWAERNNFAVAE